MKTTWFHRQLHRCLLPVAVLLSPCLHAALPVPNHIVVVILENHAYEQISGSSAAPYINSLATQGAKFTQSFALTHPSQPNYLMLFSGGNHNVTDDSCPHSFTTANLGAQLLNAGKTYASYAQSLPSTGSTVCTSGAYARKHCPWVNWQGATSNGIPSSANRPFTSYPTDYLQLPRVSFVIPDQDHDMHNGSDPTRITTADTWLKDNLDAYVQWSKTHNSLFILTFDEDNGNFSNHIFTVFVGQSVKPGTYSEHIDHYNVLRTLEDMYALPHAGNAGSATPITDCWQ